MEQTQHDWRTNQYYLSSYQSLSIKDLFIYMCFQLIAIISFSTILGFYDSNTNLFFIFTFFFLVSIIIIINFLKKKENNSKFISLITFISIWYYLLIIFTPFVDNLIVFLLFIELLSIYYYFFFLNVISNSINTLIKLKNMLSNYLILSFLTMITFLIGLFFCIFHTGTTNFLQLVATQSLVSKYSWIFIFFSIMWKIGAPGFHFFKLELYQYLDLNSLIFFSLITVYFNSYILIFFFYNFLPFFIYSKYEIITILLSINTILLVRGLKLNSFYQFLGFSAINTWSTILMMFLV